MNAVAPQTLPRAKDGAAPLHARPPSPSSPQWFAALWWFVLLIRASCCAFLSLATVLHAALLDPTMAYYADLLGPTGRGQLLPSMVVCACLAVVHGLDLAAMAASSVRARELVFASTEDSQRSSGQAPRTAATWVRAATAKSACSTQRKSLPRVLKRMRASLVGQHGVLNLHSKHFDARFDVQESLEITLQVYQAYMSSKLIAVPWLNSLTVALLVLNCWSTPLIRYVCRRRLRVRVATTTERILCVAADLALDFGASVLVPALIFAPYVAAFDRARGDFPFELLYDEVWFMQLIYAAQRVFATSVHDSVFTLLPHVGIYLALASLVALARRECPHKWTCTRAGGPSAPSQRPSSPLSLRPQHVAVSSFKQQSRCSSESTGALQPLHLHPHHARHSTRVRLTTTLFVLGGAIVSAIHVHALFAFTPGGRPMSCTLHLQPWFARQYACSVFHYNCHRRGSTSVHATELDALDPDALMMVIFSHCAALVVPPHVARFRYLFGLELYNCTLAAWDAGAAVSERTHERLQYVILSRVNMTELPAGLQQPLPHSLHDIEIVASNLTALPADLHSAWRHPLMVLYLEHCGFHELPATLAHIQVLELSLVGNPIESLASYTDADAAVLRSFEKLSLSSMPVRELPDWDASALSSLRHLAIERTAVQVLPPWLLALTASNPRLEVYGFGSPVCATVETEQSGVKSAWMCSQRDDAEFGKYPLEAMAALRVP